MILTPQLGGIALVACQPLLDYFFCKQLYSFNILLLLIIIICGAFNKFTDFFVQAFKIVVDSWKFSMFLLYILWDDRPIFMIWGSNEQEDILSEKASTLEIGSVAFPAGQCTSPQLHPCHRLFDQDGHQDSSSASL